MSEKVVVVGAGIGGLTAAALLAKAAAEVALPGLRAAVRLILPGTPVTFQRYTSRSLGWVGGFPQTSLFRAWGPHAGDGLWLVGDSIFPGQSILATALGGTRVARTMLAEMRRDVGEGRRDGRLANRDAEKVSSHPPISTAGT